MRSLSQCHKIFITLLFFFFVTLPQRGEEIAVYFPQPQWNVLRLRSGRKGERTLCFARAHEGVAIYCASDKKQALILLLCDRGLPQTSQAGGLRGLIGPWQAGRQAGRPVAARRRAKWRGLFVFCGSSRHMSACVAVASSRVWSPGFGEMIVIALVLALKMPF